MMGILIWAAVILIGIIVTGLIVSSLYKRATKKTAFVRTGMGGEKVVINGGAVIFPVFHGVVDVNMETMKIEVRRSENSALITKDRMRVDVTAEFFVRVEPVEEAISNAAQTLGDSTTDSTALKALVEGKFVDALRSVASTMTMSELHENRPTFVSNVQEVILNDLKKNGLQLESVALTSFDQTSKEHFNPNNAFDAEGLTALTQSIEARKKMRNDIEQQTTVEIAERDLTAARELNAIRMQTEKNALDTEREIENSTSTQAQDTAKVRAETGRQIREADIAADQAVSIAEENSKIAVFAKNKEVLGAQADLFEKEKATVQAKESVETTREVEIAERSKKLAVISAEEQAEALSIGKVVAARADMEAAENYAAAKRIAAEGEAQAIITMSEANAKAYEVEAEGKRKINAAQNVLSQDQMYLQMRLALIQNLPAIIEASVRPIENIDGIKIVQMGGSSIPGASAGSGAAVATGNGSLPEQIVSAALAMRVHGPLVDNLMETVGMSGTDLAGFVEPLNEIIAGPAKVDGGGSAVEGAVETNGNKRSASRGSKSSG